jgi:hypothetical protein
MRVWRPSSEAPGNSGLTVPYNGQSEKMTRKLYELHLENRLRKLVEQDPEKARRILQRSIDHLPDLYRVTMDCEPKDWPGAILASEM